MMSSAALGESERVAAHAQISRLHRQKQGTVRVTCSVLLMKVFPQKGVSIFLSRFVTGRELRNRLKVQSGLDTRLSWICDVPEDGSSWITCTIVPGIR